MSGRIRVLIWYRCPPDKLDSFIETFHAISTQLAGEYGVRGTCTSVPTLVGRGGVLKRYEVELWPRELSGIQQGAKSLDATYAQIR